MGHHYVPREYLRGFTHPSSPEALWQFDKETHTFTPKPASIAKIAQQRSFYDDDTERKLNDLVEIPGNEVLRKLRSGDLHLADEERLHLAIYIATMLNRVPYSRAKSEQLAPELLTKVSAELREQIRAAEESGQLSPSAAANHIAETDAAEAKFAVELPGNVRDQIRSPWPTERTVNAVYSMHWRFVRASSGHFFVTTDNPAFFFVAYGLATERAELTFPVSSDLAIFGSWKPVTENKKVSRRTQFVKEGNRRLISEAVRFVYSRSPAGWIPTVAEKGDPYLSRISW